MLFVLTLKFYHVWFLYMIAYIISMNKLHFFFLYPIMIFRQGYEPMTIKNSWFYSLNEHWSGCSKDYVNKSFRSNRQTNDDFNKTY